MNTIQYAGLIMSLDRKFGKMGRFDVRQADSGFDLVTKDPESAIDAPSWSLAFSSLNDCPSLVLTNKSLELALLEKCDLFFRKVVSSESDHRYLLDVISCVRKASFRMIGTGTDMRYSFEPLDIIMEREKSLLNYCILRSRAEQRSFLKECQLLFSLIFTCTHFRAAGPARATEYLSLSLYHISRTVSFSPSFENQLFSVLQSAKSAGATGKYSTLQVMDQQTSFAISFFMNECCETCRVLSRRKRQDDGNVSSESIALYQAEEQGY